jgi:hypothetical protein
MTSETSGNKQQQKCPLYVNYSIKIPLATARVSVGCRAYYFIVNMCCQFRRFCKLKYQKRTFDTKNLRYGLKFMSGVVVNGNSEKQVFILAKVGFVSDMNGCEKLHYGFRFSIKVDINI